MGTITVVGTGCREGELSDAARALLMSGAKIILHTENCRCAEWLNDNGIGFSSLDDLYESCEDFDEHARLAAERVALAADDGDVVYCVMDVRDESARILAKNGARVCVGAMLEGALWALADGAVTAFSASDCAQLDINPDIAALVREIDSRELACEVKLKLMEAFPDDAEMFVLTGGGVANIPLYKLDRLTKYDHTVAALVNPIRDIEKKRAYTLKDAGLLVRNSREAYKKADFDSALNALENALGAAAYAEDRGEYSAVDLVNELCLKLLGEGR